MFYGTDLDVRAENCKWPVFARTASSTILGNYTEDYIVIAICITSLPLIEICHSCVEKLATLDLQLGVGSK